MSNRIAFGIVGFLVAVTPALTFAQTAPDLSAQIQALLAQVQTLQAQLATLQPHTTTNTSSAACVDLPASLGRGDEGTNVTKLQQFLAAAGLLSANDVIGIFGQRTETAVKAWQAARGIVSSGDASSTGYGYVGNQTRAAMACSGGNTSTNTNTSAIADTSSVSTQITALYQSILGRAPDTAGLNYWVQQVGSGAVTLDSVRRNFEATRDITKLYNDILGREPDAGGLSYWVGEYLAGRSTLASIRQNFTNTWTAQNQSCSAGTGGTYPYCVTFTAAGSPTLSCSASTVAPGGNISGTVTGLTSGDATNRNLSVSVFKASDTLSTFSLAQAAGFAPNAIPVPTPGTAPSPQTVTFNVPTNASGSYQMRLVAGSALASCSFTVSGTVPVTGATVIQSIIALYKEILGRDPDVAGLNYWAAQFNSGAVTMAKVRQNFEATRDITALYREVLGREPDTAGLNYWVTEYLAGRSTLASINQQFINDKARDAASTTNTSSCPVYSPPHCPAGQHLEGAPVTYDANACPNSGVRCAPDTTTTNSTTNTTTTTRTPVTASCSAGSTVSAAVGDSITVTIPSPPGAAWLGIYDYAAVYRASEPTTSNTVIAAGFSPGSYIGTDSWGSQTRTFNVRSAAPGSYQIRTRNPQQDQSTGAITYTPTTLCTFTVVSPTASSDTSKSAALSQLASALAAILSIIGGQGR